ncbi:hypothetical protein CDV55_102357 [Aspergillus turcosus]|nr:hypothetical protein CDV55_102357 [Aspergillus turcosus]
MEDFSEIYPTVELNPPETNGVGFEPEQPAPNGLSSAVPWPGLPLSPGTPQSGYYLSLNPGHYERPPYPHQSATSTSSPGRDGPGTGVAKVAIPRAAPYSIHSQRRRSARACEPCRQRKIKCDGNKPVCRQCHEHHVTCSYLDVKRVRDQKQLGVLSHRVKEYESLLRDLETEVDANSARRIRRTLKTSNGDNEDGALSDSSSSSVGSLNAIDMVEEDLNRSQKTRATGYFGKNSEVSWMQKLEDEAENRSRMFDGNFEMLGLDEQSPPQKNDVPIATMSYHLDDLNIPLMDDVDPYDLPPKELADRFFAAYMDSVHPAFEVIRKTIFVTQYRQFFKQPSKPPRRWLAILNMIFALGCRYCLLLNDGAGVASDEDWDDLVYFNRARKLCLGETALFEHTDLQQIQVEILVALYLVVLGQINRASNFASMAFRSALSLGINLRFEDDRTHHASKEARSRLWWSIYAVEHLLTATTGRASCVGEGLSAAPLPIPFEEENFDKPHVLRFFQDPSLRASQLKLTLFETDEEAQSKAQWLATCEPSPSLFFHCFVDLCAITQAVINKVYSIQGLRDTASQVEQRVRKYSAKLDTWLAQLPPAYRFTTHPHPHDTLHLPDDAFMRERVCLAIAYYSARITISRPCLTHTHPKPKDPSKDDPSKDPSSKEPSSLSSSPETPDLQPPKSTTRSTSTTTNDPSTGPSNSSNPSNPTSGSTTASTRRTNLSASCLRSACTLLSILPDQADPTWLLRFSPWWSILHYLMQATTALLLSLSSSDVLPSTPLPNAATYGPAPDTQAVIRCTKKSLRWLHAMGKVNAASRRAFVLCDSFMRRIAPSVGVEVGDLPDGSALPTSSAPAGANANANSSSGFVLGGNGNGGEVPDGDGVDILLRA